MIKYLALLLPILMLLVPTPAEAYYMEYLNFVWDNPPIVCIWDSDYNRHATIAVLKWYDALVDDYGDKFAFTTLIISGEIEFEILKDCNINIIYVEMEYASAEDLDGVSGRSIIDLSESVAYIYVYEGLYTHYPTLEDFDNTIIRTTMHEIGHGFGLGHVMPESIGEGLRPWPDTLMWAYSGALTDTEIDEHTLLAFKCLYNTNGWKGNHPNTCPRFNMDLQPLYDPSKF